MNGNSCGMRKTLATMTVAAAWAVGVMTGVGAARAETHVVQQTGLSFVPSAITVTAGDTIQWVYSSGSHTVTSGPGCGQADGLFNMPLNSANPLAEYTVPADFGDAEIPYHCTPHCSFGMTGNITVMAASAPCPGDLDGGGSVAFSDLLLLLNDWGICNGCPADLDHDGSVGFSDVLLLLGSWGKCP